MRLEDLPQGILLPAAAPASKEGTKNGEESASDSPNETSNDSRPDSSDSGPAYPTVIMQARRNMHKFSNCVLLTRVGGFYELYFEHAQEYGPLLNIKVASKKTNAGQVPMVSLSSVYPMRFCPPPPHTLVSSSSHSALSYSCLTNPSGG